VKRYRELKRFPLRTIRRVEFIDGTVMMPNREDHDRFLLEKVEL
jgi:hypothetical protein